MFDEKYFYLHDRIGSIRQVIDKDANVKNCYTYDPWGLTIGDETAETGTFFNPYRFAGYFWEPEISQYHCFHRQYDPVLARFTSRDPVMGRFQEPLTLHAYLYCLNDPVNFTDPTGRSILSQFMAATSIISGIVTTSFAVALPSAQTALASSVCVKGVIFAGSTLVISSALWYYLEFAEGNELGKKQKERLKKLDKYYYGNSSGKKGLADPNFGNGDILEDLEDILENF